MKIKNAIKEILIFFKRNLPLILALLFWFGLTIFLNIFIKDLFVLNKFKILGREKILMIFFIMFTTGLAVFIIIYLLISFIKFLRKVFGSMLKFKLIVSFSLVVILPIIPFINIGTQFIRASMDLWFSENFAQSFDMANDLIDAYYDEKKSYLLNQTELIKDFYNQRSFSTAEIWQHLPEACENVSVDNVTLLNENVDFIGQVGKQLWDVDIPHNRFKKNVAFKLKVFPLGIFFQEHNNDLYLVVPIEIVDLHGQQCGYINVANKINPTFKVATTNIQESLRTYNIVSLYKNFFMQSFTILFIGSTIPIFLVILIISIFFSTQIVGPISSLEKTTKDIANNNFELIDTTKFTDEFVGLVNSFNAMISEIQFSRQQLQQQEKVASWNEISRRFAHEVRNPLTSIQLSMERVIRKYNKNAEDFGIVFDKSANAILREISRMNTMLTNFSQIASLSENNMTIGNILPILKDSVDLLSINKNHVTLEILPEIKDFTVNRDEVQLKSVFNNLLLNAIDASEVGSKIEIDMQDEVVGFKKYALISIKDFGSGIVGTSDGIKNVDIFQPYYSTKPTGTGLGLAICQRMVDQHNGRIFYETSTNESDHGTTFFIELPIVD